RGHAQAGRRAGSAHAHLLAAHAGPVLLRHRYPAASRPDRQLEFGRRNPRLHRSRLAALPLRGGTAARGWRRSGLLHGVLYAGVSDRHGGDSASSRGRNFTRIREEGEGSGASCAPPDPSPSSRLRINCARAAEAPAVAPPPAPTPPPPAG